MRALVLFVLLFTAFPAAACFKDCEPDDRAYRIARHYEGLRLFSYTDVAGHGTIGFGHLIRPGESFSEPLTGDQAEALLEADEKIAVHGVNRLVDIPMNLSQFDALVDFSFNLGTGTLSKSPLLTAVNAGQHDMAADKFLLYDKARVNGVLTFFRGLFNRRVDESTLYRGKV